MASKAKYAIGGALSGAAAGSAAGPWGIAIGALAGGLLGASQAPGDLEKQKQLDQALIDKLANQALGNEATASELNLRQAFDRTLAQQISAARTQSRGVNPALQSRQISRLASERAADAAAESAKLSVSERANSFDKYIKAIQYNNGVLAQNQAQEAGQEKSANLALSNGLVAGADAATKFAVARDTKAQQAADAAKKTQAIPGAPVATEGTQAAQAQNSAYSLNAQPTSAVAQPFNSPLAQQAQPDAMALSDKNAKMNSRYLVSDERQKDLIKSEDLPQNQNFQMQNMQSQQPQAAPPSGTPIAPQPQVPANPAVAAQTTQAQLTGATPAAPAANFVVSPEMIAKAQKSMRQGGNVSDITNVANPMTPPSGAISPEQDARLRADAEREATRQNTWDNRLQGKNKDANTLYQEYLAGFNANQANNMADYQQSVEKTDAINKAKGLERSARLANFYTGMSTTTPQDVAQAYGSNKITAKGPDLNSNAQQAGNNDWQRLATEYADFINPSAQIGRAVLGHDNGDVGNFIKNPVGAIANLFSDENSKTSKKPEVKNSKDNMNPKNFLDKLHAYSFEYKDEMKNVPGAGDGRKLGVMAQEVEQAGPVGEQMVKEDPVTGLKQLDTVQGFGAVLASQVQLNERLKELEAKYKSKKGS